MEKIIKISFLFSTVLLAAFCTQGFDSARQQLKIDKYYVKEVGFTKFNLDSLNVDLNKLIAVDSSDSALKSMKRNNTSAQYYYYSVLDTSAVQSVVYLYSNEGKEQCLELINFEKNGDLISTVPLFCTGGDAEDYYTIESEFTSNKVISQSIFGDYFNESDSLIITDKLFLKLKLNHDGSIKKDTIR